MQTNRMRKNCMWIMVAALCAPSLPAQDAQAGDTQPGDTQPEYVWPVDWRVAIDGEHGPEDLGNTHGCMVVRPNGNILANTDKEHAVVEFSPDGSLVRTWGEQFHGGLHGMCLRIEDGKEVLYLAHTRRHEVVKTTIDGKVLCTIGWPKESGAYKDASQYKPTGVAVAPDGRIFVGDGYGKSWVHIYDKDRNYVKSFGGWGDKAGQFKTPHGVWMDTRGDEALLLVCDRENHRLQWFTLDGEFVRMTDKDLRRPCNVWPMQDGGLVVADLVGRISFVAKNGKVTGHYGDNADPKLRAKNNIDKPQWKVGEFLSPHSVCVGLDGCIYVMDWNFRGRITKLVPKAPTKKL